MAARRPTQHQLACRRVEERGINAGLRQEPGSRQFRRERERVRPSVEVHRLQVRARVHMLDEAPQRPRDCVQVLAPGSQASLRL